MYGRLFFVFCIAIFFSLRLNAQVIYLQDQPDQIFLKNSMVLEGEIMKYRKGDFLVLERVNGSEIKVKIKQILFVRQNEKRTIDLPSELFLLRDLFPDSLQTEAKLYLKDGKMIIGALKNYEKGETITIGTQKGETLVYAEEEIDHLEQRVILDEKEQQKRAGSKIYNFRERGFYFLGALSISGSRTFEQLQTGVGFHAIFGYQHRLILGAGLGIGYDTYLFQGEGESFIPVYLELRGYFSRAIKAPYYFISGGYGFPDASVKENTEVGKFEGGRMLHSGLGYRFGATRSINFTVDVGYKFQKAYLERVFLFNGDFEKRTITYRRFTIRLGMIF